MDIMNIPRDPEERCGWCDDHYHRTQDCELPGVIDALKILYGARLHIWGVYTANPGASRAAWDILWRKTQEVRKEHQVSDLFAQSIFENAVGRYHEKKRLTSKR